MHDVGPVLVYARDIIDARESAEFMGRCEEIEKFKKEQQAVVAGFLPNFLHNLSSAQHISCSRQRPRSSMTNWKGSSGGGTRDSGPKPPDPRLLAGCET
jgi:hypothetical protein